MGLTMFYAIVAVIAIASAALGGTTVSEQASPPSTHPASVAAPPTTMPPTTAPASAVDTAPPGTPSYVQWWDLAGTPVGNPLPTGALGNVSGDGAPRLVAARPDRSGFRVYDLRTGRLELDQDLGVGSVTGVALLDVNKDGAPVFIVSSDAGRIVAYGHTAALPGQSASVQASGTAPVAKSPGYIERASMPARLDAPLPSSCIGPTAGDGAMKLVVANAIRSGILVYDLHTGALDWEQDLGSAEAVKNITLQDTDGDLVPEILVTTDDAVRLFARAPVKVAEAEPARAKEDTVGVPVPKPTPISASTTIRFSLARSGRTQIKVFDPLGNMVREVVDAPLNPGPHRVTWDGLTASGDPASPGLYYFRMFVDGKMIGTERSFKLGG
jgi:hypothetical protein